MSLNNETEPYNCLKKINTLSGVNMPPNESLNYLKVQIFQTYYPLFIPSLKFLIYFESNYLHKLRHRLIY